MSRLSVPQLDPGPEEELRQVAAEMKLPQSKVAELAILEFLRARKAARLGPPDKKETTAQRQARFLRALEENFHLPRTCKVTGIERAEVVKWRKNAKFAAELHEAQSCFVESIEWKIIRMGVRKKKPQLLALLSFLNAHHPQWGRLKYEAVIRWYGPVIEGIFATIRQELGEENGEALCKRVNEISEKALSKLSD